ncbi:unnamed protein product, partial [Rotaria sp. Silwood1]
CYTTAKENFNLAYDRNFSIYMNVDEAQPIRATAGAVLSNILALTQVCLLSSDRDNSSSETSDEEVMNLTLH